MSLNFSFKDHKELRGQHALFSPSQSAWLRYEEDKIAEKVRNQYRAPLGTEIHDFAATQIELRHKVSNVRGLGKEIENYIYCKYKYLDPKNEIGEFGMKLVQNVGYLPKEVFETVKYYVNDGIGYKMSVEQPLVYSLNVFGTADTISFRNDILRIHDLKTGALPAHMEQLETYAALFCLEYGIKPSEINIELRMYQWDGIIVNKPTVEDILPIMDRIVTIEKIANSIEEVEA